MGDGSAIEWTEATWNPVTGCTKVSPGCKSCYAEVMAKRLHAMGQPNYRNAFALTVHEHMLDVPRRWKKGRRIFVNSMSDLFHKDVPLDFIKRVFAVMAEEAQHQFQVLTKRSERLREVAGELPWAPNVWMGVSVENDDHTFRIDDLLAVPAMVRFLSAEPLLGPIDHLNLAGVHWVIVGGESGSRARPMSPAWVRAIRDQCIATNVPFFFKQWGGKNKKAAGRVLDGRTWDQFPTTTAQAS